MSLTRLTRDNLRVDSVCVFESQVTLSCVVCKALHDPVPRRSTRGYAGGRSIFYDSASKFRPTRALIKSVQRRAHEASWPADAFQHASVDAIWLNRERFLRQPFLLTTVGSTDNLLFNRCTTKKH